jgi:hypothetical protein
LRGSVPATGWRHTEDPKRRISLATSASLKEHWRTPHGQDVLLRRKEMRLSDRAIPHCDERIASWLARRESLETELARIVEMRRGLASSQIARSQGYLHETDDEVCDEPLRQARA